MRGVADVCVKKLKINLPPPVSKVIIVAFWEAGSKMGFHVKRWLKKSTVGWERVSFGSMHYLIYPNLFSVFLFIL